MSNQNNASQISEVETARNIATAACAKVQPILDQAGQGGRAMVCELEAGDLINTGVAIIGGFELSRQLKGEVVLAVNDAGSTIYLAIGRGFRVAQGFTA